MATTLTRSEGTEICCIAIQGQDGQVEVLYLVAFILKEKNKVYYRVNSDRVVGGKRVRDYWWRPVNNEGWKAVSGSFVEVVEIHNRTCAGIWPPEADGPIEREDEVEVVRHSA